MTRLSQSLPIFKKNGLFLTAYLITFIVIIMLMSTIEVLATPFPAFKAGVVIVYLLMGAVFTHTIFNYSLQAVRGEELKLPEWRDIVRFVPNYLIASLLLSATMLPLGIIAYTINPEAVIQNNFQDIPPSLSLTIAGIISLALYIFVYIRLGFYIFILTEQPMRFDRALMRSWKLTKGNSKRIFLTGMLCMGLLLLGLLLLFIGMFPACVLCYLIMGGLYNNMIQTEIAENIA